MNFFHDLAAQDLGGALGVADVHAEEDLHNGVEDPAGKPPLPGLHFVEHRPWQPTGADDAIGFSSPADQIQQGRRFRRAIGIHVSDQVGHWSELEALDQGAAFADRLRELDQADGGEIGRDRLDDAQGVVAAAVENDDELEFSLVIAGEVFGVTTQSGANPALLIVRRNQQQKAWKTLIHALYLPKFGIIVKVKRLAPAISQGGLDSWFEQASDFLAGRRCCV